MSYEKTYVSLRQSEIVDKGIEPLLALNCPLVIYSQTKIAFPERIIVMIKFAILVSFLLENEYVNDNKAIITFIATTVLLIANNIWFLLFYFLKFFRVVISKYY